MRVLTSDKTEKEYRGIPIGYHIIERQTQKAIENGTSVQYAE